jgi:hypothetical protein
MLLIYTARGPRISSIILFGGPPDFANLDMKIVRPTQRLAR